MKAKKATVGLVGAGRAATGLAVALRRRGFRIAGFVARRPSSARRAARAIGLRGGGAGDLALLVRNASVLLICVPDAEIPRVAAALSRLPPGGLLDKVVLHTSGAVGVAPLAPLRDMGARVGGLHPLVSFSRVGVSPPGIIEMRGIAFAIGGDPAAVRAARALVRALGGLPILVAEEDRAAYHLAATLVASGTAALLDVGIDIATRRLGLSRVRARAALTALLASVVRNVARDGAGKGLTGPVSRGDAGTVARHLEALRKEDPSVRELYRLVSLRGVEMSLNDGRLDIAMANDLRKRLDDD